MLHRTSMTAKLSCFVGAAVLAAGLVCAVLSCDGIGTSVNSDSNPYGGMGGSGGSGSGSTGGSGGSGSGSTGTGNFTVEELLSHANAGNSEAFLELLTGSGGTEEVGTFMVVFSAADIGLPAGGSVTLSITGDGYNYDGTAQAAGDGSISFELPRIVVGTTVTMTLEVKEADGSVVATGTKTQQVPEGGCDFGIALVDTAPAPAPMPADFVPVGGGLYMCIHELTQGEYEAYCSYGSSGPNATKGMGPDYPAYYVSWYDALVYCNKRSMAENLTPCYTISGSTDPAVWGSVPTSSNATWNNAICSPTADGYRLPTEAEWEYAAKGGPTNDSYIYSGSDDIEAVAWYTSNSGNKTHEVKTKAPNSLGLYDMSGNVWEWCWDNYSPGSSSRAYRGGSWDYVASICTVSSRSNYVLNGRDDDVGFRLVRKAP